MAQLQEFGCTDQFQDAVIKDPHQDQQGHCLHVHSLSPDLFFLLVPLPPYKNPCLHWDGTMGFEMRVPHLPGGQHLNKTTFLYISTCLLSIGFQSSRQLDLPRTDSSPLPPDLKRFTIELNLDNIYELVMGTMKEIKINCYGITKKGNIASYGIS